MNNRRNAAYISVMGMLLGAQIVLGMTASIQLGPSIRLSFGYLACASAGMLLGPGAAASCAALADILVYCLKPSGAYHPGFTLSAALGGIVYGLLFYRKDIKLYRVIIAKLIIDICVNLCLNTLWINQLYGKAFMALLPGRALKNVAQLPVDVLLLYPLLKTISKYRDRIPILKKLQQ